MSAIGLRVSCDCGALDAGLAAMNARVATAIARGLNAGGEKVRTRVQRELKEQTGVKAYRSITSRVRTARAFAGGLAYQIIVTGKGIPVEEFPVAVTAKGVDAKTWGVDHLFKRSFREKDRGGLRARTTSSRFPIRRLYGPSLPKELGKGSTPGAFYVAVSEFVGPAILRNLARVAG